MSGGRWQDHSVFESGNHKYSCRRHSFDSEDELCQFKAVFGELKANRGSAEIYLGMNFGCRQPEDGMKITMSGLADEFPNDMDKPIPGCAKTPAGRDSFTVDDGEPATEEQKEVFHSTSDATAVSGKKNAYGHLGSHILSC